MQASSFKSITVLSLALLFTVGCLGSKSRLKLGKTDEGEVVEAEGLAPNNPSDLIATKRASLTDAQRNAVEKVVGVFVSARTLVEQAMAIENNILAQTEGYVKKYDVLNEVVEDGFYKTKIRALVGLKDLEADLKELSLLQTPELQRPSVFVQLTEKIGANKVADLPSTRSLERSLMDQGFNVLSEDRKKEAELFIRGSVSAFPFQTEGLGGFISFRARLTAQVSRPGTKDVVLSLSKEASGLGGNNQLAAMKALETVGELSGSELGEKVAEAWARGKKLLVFVEGVKSFSDVDRVKKHFTAQPGIKDIVLRMYDEEMAQFELQLSSVRPEELAARIEKSRTLPMKVLEASNQTLRLGYK